MNNEMHIELASSINKLAESISSVRQAIDGLSSKISLISMITAFMILEMSILAVLAVPVLR